MTSNCFVRVGIICMAAVLCHSSFAADAYAYRVQYLESTPNGGQYIDTGLIPTYNTTFEGKYEYVAYGNGVNSNFDMIAGSAGPTNKRYYPVSLNKSGISDIAGLADERYVLSGKQGNVNHGNMWTSHTIIFNDRNHRITVDGGMLDVVLDKDVDGEKKRPCFLFAACNSDDGKPKYFSASRIYGCRFIDSSEDAPVVLRSFIPVVDMNGRPAMFDEVESRLYYNKGTDDEFIAGPRLWETPWYFVEYLEADGNQWIETGRLATSNTQTKVGYRYTEESQATYAMIGGSQNPRYYPASVDGSNAKKERYCYSDGSVFSTSYPALQRHEVVFNDAAKNIFVDGLRKGTLTAEFGDSKYTMCMFAARNKSGNVEWPSKSRIWHYDIFEKDLSVCSFIPAVSPKEEGGNYEPCMHDRRSGRNHFNQGTGAFRVGRIISPEVPLKLAERGITPSGNLRVLEFSERPSYGTVFTVDEEYAGDYDAVVRDDGVYVVAKGTGGDASRIIAVTGSTSAQFAVGAMPVCSSVVLSGTVVLAADCDWTGLGKLVIPDRVTIDLNGHNLHLSGFTCLPGDTATITDSSDNGGELHFSVEENDVLMNDCVALGGSLRLVKHGAGIFVAAKMDQTYTGGTDVDGGILRMANKDMEPRYRKELGAGISDVRIGEGAQLFNNGYYNYEFSYTFDGGTLTSGNSPEDDYRQVGAAVTLSGDAMLTGQDMGFIAGSYKPVAISMNGNKMTVDLAQSRIFSFCNATFVGEGVLEGLSGWIRSYANPSVGANLTLRFPTEHGGLYLEKNFTVSNFISHCYSYHKGGDDAALTVLGTFTPAERGRTAFPNMVLADGSTIDLSLMGDNPTLLATCEQADGKTKRIRRISFEENATIGVRIGNRRISRDIPVIGWTEPPANIDSVTFKLAEGERSFHIRKGGDGVYIDCGLVFIVR